MQQEDLFTPRHNLSVIDLYFYAFTRPPSAINGETRGIMFSGRPSCCPSVFRPLTPVLRVAHPLVEEFQ